MMFLYGLLALGLAIIVIITIFCICHIRQKRITSANLNNMSWRIRSDEVVLKLGVPIGFQVPAQKHQYCSFRASHVSPTVGTYKGNQVVIKKIIKKKIDINNKKLLWEFKQVQDVTHENTVRFMGAYIECPNVLILTEYCPRGSLKDVLENEAIHSDWNFRMSLIYDLVKGMSYLHSSQVSVHGKLHSSNCLIDGGFVLKISDFGLNTITTPQKIENNKEYFIKLLWVAPELLPMTLTPSCKASQKGDVYLFAIILEEIIVRGGPYECVRQFLQPFEIITRVANRENPPFRPIVCQLHCPDYLTGLMEKCWSENIEERPSFESIKVTLRSVMRGYHDNLMDDLLRRMEQYEHNLEACRHVPLLNS